MPSATVRFNLHKVLRLWDPAAGPNGFEGLVTHALAELTGYTFRLARSGAQFGRDAATTKAPFSIAMEAKRYTDSVPLQELVGKATLAAAVLAEGIDLCPHHSFERRFPLCVRCRPVRARSLRGSVKGMVPWTKEQLRKVSLMKNTVTLVGFVGNTPEVRR